MAAVLVRAPQMPSIKAAFRKSVTHGAALGEAIDDPTMRNVLPTDPVLMGWTVPPAMCPVARPGQVVASDTRARPARLPE